ncbi:EamA family transporter [Streptomyces sp. NPDC048639]|uniref:EamA family transporter n=1 Tax=Streptomyces sp. NPDC048639 TaxID=3365581 RepID=UPI00371336C1
MIALVLFALFLQALCHNAVSILLSPRESLAFSFVAFVLAAVVFLVVRHLGGRSSRTPTGRATKEPATTGPLSTAPTTAERASADREVRRWVRAINVAGAVSFLCFYAALTLLPASIVTVVEASAGPLVLLGLVTLSSSRNGTLVHKRGRAQWLLASVMPLISLLMCVAALREHSTAETVAGAALALVSGVGVAFVAVSSHHLARHGVSPTHVMSVRFHLSYILALALHFITAGALPTDWQRLLLMVALGLGAVVVPLFLFQIALHRIRPIVFLLLFSCLPAITLGLEWALGRAPDTTLLALTGAALAVSLAYVLSEHPSSHRARKASRRGRQSEARGGVRVGADDGRAHGDAPARVLLGDGPRLRLNRDGTTEVVRIIVPALLKPSSSPPASGRPWPNSRGLRSHDERPGRATRLPRPLARPAGAHHARAAGPGRPHRRNGQRRRPSRRGQW